MPTTPQTARDEMFALLHDDRANYPVADVVDRWQGVETKKEADEADKTLIGDYWFRAGLEIIASPQSAFTNDGISRAQYTTTGLLIVQVFAPRSKEDSWRKGDLLANHIRDIYRSTETASGVCFYRPVAKPLNPDGSFHRWNVVVEFKYDELH